MLKNYEAILPFPYTMNLSKVQAAKSKFSSIMKRKFWDLPSFSCLLSSLDSSELTAYNSVQMFEPFQDQTPHFFGKIILSWFVMQDFQKLIGSKVLWPNHSGTIFQGKVWIFVEVTFFNPSEIRILGLTWRVTLL